MLSRHAGRTRGRVLGDAGRVLPLAGSVLQARERTCPSTPSQTSPHTRSSVGSGQARHGGRGEGACVPPRRSGRVLWRGHAGTRACGKANLSTSPKSFLFQCSKYPHAEHSPPPSTCTGRCEVLSRLNILGWVEGGSVGRVARLADRTTAGAKAGRAGGRPGAPAPHFFRRAARGESVGRRPRLYRGGLRRGP